jgi:hypothetical protein
MFFLAEFSWASLQLPTPVALSIVALLGYIVGRRKQEHQHLTGEVQARRELKRAQAVAKELERIAVAVRRSLATHHSSVLKFKDRVSNLGGNQQDAAWQELCSEAEGMLKPTLKLAAQLAAAYDEIRHDAPLRAAILGRPRGHRLLQANQRRAGTLIRRPDAQGRRPPAR